jgi:hypothetical protein
MSLRQRRAIETIVASSLKCHATFTGIFLGHQA